MRRWGSSYRFTSVKAWAVAAQTQISLLQSMCYEDGLSELPGRGGSPANGRLALSFSTKRAAP